MAFLVEFWDVYLSKQLLHIATLHDDSGLLLAPSIGNQPVSVLIHTTGTINTPPSGKDEKRPIQIWRSIFTAESVIFFRP